jgi:hypothetical protein
MSDAINKPAHYNQGSIECIDAMQIVLTPEEYRGFLKGNAIKYLWREENKGGIEDLRKAKWYLDRLIEHCDESLLDANKPAKPPNEQPQLPDGWRWLEVGEVFRKGDTTNTIEPISEHWVGTQCVVKHVALRRNRFEVGEKVVHVNDHPSIVYIVNGTRGDGAVTVSCENIKYAISPDKLAPYIEETT